MKKQILIFALAIFAFAACSKDKDDTKPANENAKKVEVDATSKTDWHYFSFTENKIVGSDAESPENNAKWSARKDWDMAICRYEIRTNSGEATTVDAKGGVHTMDAATTFASVTAVPEGANFATDKAVTEDGMGGIVTKVKSTAQVVTLKVDEEGNVVMPAVFLQAPVYIFRTADGAKYFKVLFTQYKDENNVSGKVKFDFEEIK